MINIRIATEKDLPEILVLYAQPDMDNGKVLELEGAKAIFARMKVYPDYNVYIAENEGKRSALLPLP